MSAAFDFGARSGGRAGLQGSMHTHWQMGENSSARGPASVLAVNAGSSSIRFAVYGHADPVKPHLRGKIERIGLADPALSVDGPEDACRQRQPIAARDHAGATNALIDWLDAQRLLSEIVAIGHRVVHGGARYTAPTVVSAQLLEELRRISAYSPEHLPAEIGLIEHFARRLPDVPQVACFDTAFHRDMPRIAQLLPIPRRLDAKGVRRFGFHGLSYAFLMEEFERLAGEKEARGRIVLAHLGNGSSLAAVRDGKSMDTTMAFTPAAGVPMSTRSGDLDPGLAWYLSQTEGQTAEAFNRMVNHESGLLGVSQTSSDLRDLLGTEKTDVRAAEAVALYCYNITKAMGAFAAALGGLDTVIFAGGIGENSSPVRARICAPLAFLGIALDERRNSMNEPVISAEGGRVTVRVIHTDEETMIARATCRALPKDHS